MESTVQSRLKVGDVIDGKYVLTRLVGEGGMGEVWEARHKVLGRRAALKFLHPELTTDRESNTRFLREAQAAAAIGSEFIVDVVDIGETQDGAPYLVMEYLDGPDLRDVIACGKALDPVRAARLTRQICVALDAAHRRSIVHRDLKPENIVVVRSGDGSERIKVLDFGIAKFHDLRLTATGVVMGTPAYMAPEQAMASPDADHRLDIYSTGAILYEMLTGRPPFSGASRADVLMQVVTTEPIPPRKVRPEIPAALERVVVRAMAKDRAARFASMDDFAEALEPFAGDSGRGASSGPSGEPEADPIGPTQDESALGLFSHETLPAADPAAAADLPSDTERSQLPPTFDVSRGQAAVAQPAPARRRRPGLLAALALVIGGAGLIAVLGVVLFGPWGPTENGGSGRRRPRVSNVPGEWVRVPRGQFTMGTPEGAGWREHDEVARPVTITRPFYIQITEVARADFVRVMGFDPAQTLDCGGRCPVEGVTWHQAAAYCNTLSVWDGLSSCYDCQGSGSGVVCAPGSGFASPLSCPGYRLPTEAEWEYAARAGTTTGTYVGALGEDLHCQSPHPVLGAIAWFCGTSGGSVHPVGVLQPNGWGLHDLLGNVWEWCHDWWGALAPTPVTDPFGPPSGTFRVIRGGSWEDYAYLVRASSRSRSQPDAGSRSVGFRPVRTAR